MFGERIKELRMANNLNQVQLARALSVTKQSVSNWENDNILPSVDLLKRIAVYFSCTTDYLLELEEDGDRLFIEVEDLTIQQAAHIQRLIRDFQIVNRELKDKKQS
ncbi:MAG: helix-turn-helix domain-containing protein [Eubacterium sp.]|nr:helix-turn-helix domain-containing protein [Eubacterium sp.]